MPIYCYRSGSGIGHEESFPMGTAPQQIVRGGVKYSRCYQAEQSGMDLGDAGWPMRCEASAISPDQIPEMREWNAKRGISVDYDRLGRPEFRDRTHRSKCLKAWGYHDRDGGYRE